MVKVLKNDNPLGKSLKALMTSEEAKYMAVQSAVMEQVSRWAFNRI